MLVLVLGGGAALLGVDPSSAFSSGGTGELTVEVRDQDGRPASGQDIQVIDPETGEVVATSVSQPNGRSEFQLDQGDYEVVVAGSSRQVTLDEETTVELTVTIAPPEPD